MIDHLHENIVGIDVSKLHLDVALHNNNQTLHVTYDVKGLSQLIRWLAKHHVSLVVLEATGNYQRSLIVALHEASIAFHIANPRHVRNLAKANGQLAKTDKIDAKMIALYGHFKKPQPTPMPSNNSLKLREFVCRYRQLKQQITQQKNQLQQYYDDALVTSCRRVLRLLEQELKQVETSMQELIENHKESKKRTELMQTVPGVGKTLAYHLVVTLPELGKCNRKEIAMLVGLAPVNHDSGQYRGKRMTGGGRREVRSMLYMPMLSAIQCNPIIKKKYRQLVDQGKPKKVAIIACMRKLVTFLNSMLKDEKTWEEMTNLA